MSVSAQLRLIPATAPQSVAAGYLPGSEVGAWLAEMARHEQACCYIVPESMEAGEAGGLLILPVVTKAGGTPAFGPRVLPCTLEHGCVAVLRGMRLDPLLSDEEARRLLPYHAYFFHPVLGLVAFEATDAVSARELIVPPVARSGSWMEAMPGSPPLPRLSQVSLALPPDLDGLFGDAGADIGTANPKDLADQDSAFRKLGGNLVGGAAALGVGALGVLAKMLGAGNADQPPASGGGKDTHTRGIPLLEQLGKWTLEQMEKLQRQRENEISRLLKMLETDPDKGLRYALPFNGGGDAARGMAPPSGRLGERNPAFGSRRQGGPADVWNFSDQSRFALQQKYRDLANRELANGRFDRAAYIFAELLGDWHGAANALARGKRFQEAAHIYKTRLGNALQAAKCLEDGGLLQEAMIIYAELSQHEKCGDLLRRLGREREAVAAFHEAMKGSSDRLHDARILYEKLGQHGLAFAVLASGFPHSPQARVCLERHFEYLRRLDAHEDALVLARGLGGPDRQLSNPAMMAECLHGIHQSYPEAEVQARLAKVALVTIGTALNTGHEETHLLLELLPKFAPADRLLRRDAGRYQDQCDRDKRERKRQSSAGVVSVMTKKIWFEVAKGDGVEWRSLISRGTLWLASGVHESSKQDVWIAGEGSQMRGQVTSMFGDEWGSGPPAYLPPLPDTIWLPKAPKGQAVRYHKVIKNYFDQTTKTLQSTIGQLVWIPPKVLALYPVVNGCWVLHESNSETVDLSFYSYDGGLIRTHALGWNPPVLEGPVLMGAHGDDIFISAGRFVLLVKQGQVYRQIELNGGRVVRLVVSRLAQPAAVIWVTGSEATVMGPGKKGESVQLFTSANAGSPPEACFLADGRIAVGNGEGVLIYSAFPAIRYTHTVQFQKRQGHLVAGLAAWGEHGLAVLWEDGIMECYE